VDNESAGYTRAMSTLLVLALGCSRGSVPDLDGSCRNSAPELGEAGGTAIDSFDLDWTYSSSDDLSWAGPIQGILPQDLTSFAVTVDAGSTPSGIAWLVMDGEVVQDWSGDRRYGDAARTKGVTTDSWDSWGDSSWDSSGGTGWVPDGDGWGSHPLYHWPAPAGTVRLPMNASTQPSPGCLALVPVASGDHRDQGGQVHIVTKRSPATQDVLNLNAVLIEGAGMSEDEVWEAIAEMERIYAAEGGPALGEVTLWLDGLAGGGAYVPSSGAELSELRARDYEGEEALNMFFIADFSSESGTLGIASGIPGAMGVQGTAGSGVTISVETHLDGGGALDIPLMGGTMAHELGHQLGLYHTTEADGGTHDIIDDTPECTHDPDGDGYVTAEECEGMGGENFMFWTAGELVQETISSQQAAMLDSSPPAQ
jgi:hypothetical protein